MATLDDVRAQGYTVELAWEGWREPDNRVTVPDVYVVSRPAPQLDPTQPDYGDGGMLVYLPDDPAALDDFLREGPGVHEGQPLPAESEEQPPGVGE